ncbi:restriction endonuclease subunit S [Xanthomonas oryzae pv. oryzicola]|uniref:restriction endonuclease subunit S n=1 Tax=Xanthomonas oryzae TaxID=347 RepID=UPI000655FD14|nr:restriction endonuclease subunit S [Xanthomonas oryzae]AKO02730.1 hypothetical protein ACU15_15195 [Xanthomonas oryzae pv. oryzicola]KOR52278.1 hypothetical protein ADT27_01225 [Xanthomonas oryzae]OLK91183.1 hypothetical protein BXOR1_03225 [Xanthomonas oryzae pv. oryzicola]UNW41864.1 restriction endonuclease subunit S [Xanthomonas oryzae pv. oryzicola]
MSELPGGWVEAPLEECVDILDAQRQPINSEERTQRVKGKSTGELFPYYGATGRVGMIDGFLFDEELVALGEDGVPFFEGDKHKAYMLRGKTWVNNHAHVLRGIPEVLDNRILCHFLNQFDYREYVNGGTRLKLTQANMRRIPLRIPPLAEQKRIAQKLDALLAQVDTLKARIDAIPALLKRFRRAILSSTLSHAGHDDDRGWVSSSVADLCEAAFDGPFGSKLKSDDYTYSGVRVIRLENIGHLRFLNEKVTYVSLEKGEDLSKNEVLEGDVLFSSFVDEEVRVCQLPQSEETFINKADCFCLRVDPNVANPKFIMLALSTQETYQEIRKSVHGATRPRINLGFLKSFKVRLPPIDQQVQIIGLVEQLFAYADQLEAKVAAAQQRIDALTQSLLAKAFRGELVPQDPTDEPASVLLERIRTQRAATPKPKRGRKAATS